MRSRKGVIRINVESTMFVSQKNQNTIKMRLRLQDTLRLNCRNNKQRKYRAGNLYRSVWEPVRVTSSCPGTVTATASHRSIWARVSLFFRANTAGYLCDLIIILKLIILKMGALLLISFGVLAMLCLFLVLIMNWVRKCKLG